mgnify:CR=1 FL=1
MDNAAIFSHVDHTLLRPDAAWSEINTLCGQAAGYGAASACLPPAYVARARQAYPKLPITTVVGFPLGYSTSGAKVFEAAQAVDQGATEIDMVINLGDVKNQAFHRVLAEISAVKKAVQGRVLKVIVETGYLEQAEKIRLCQILEAGGADYLKTATGFGPGGADLADVALFRKLLPPQIKIKAAGGIRSRAAMLAFLEAGAERIGSSAAMTALFS